MNPDPVMGPRPSTETAARRAHVTPTGDGRAREITPELSTGMPSTPYTAAMHLRALLSLGLVLALLSPPASAGAQSVDELRARVARLREHRPESVPEGTLVSIEFRLDVSTRIEGRFAEQATA